MTSACSRPQDQRPPMTPAAGAARRDRRQLRAGDVRDHLLPPVVPAGPLRRPVRCARPRSTASATSRSPRRAARSSTATARSSPSSQRASRSRSRRPTCRCPLTSKRLAAPAAAGRCSSTTGSRTCSGSPTKRQQCKVPSVARPTVTTTFRISPIACAVAQEYVLLPYANVTVDDRRLPAISSTTSPSARTRSPACSVQQIYLRNYPLGTSPRSCSGPSARSPPARSRTRTTGACRRTSIGQSGLEGYYDRYLRGTDGAEKVQVDALGQLRRATCRSTAPVPGHNLKLSLDARLAGGRPAGAPAVDRLQLPGQRRRVRGDEPGQRRGLRDGLATRRSTRTCSPSRVSESVYDKLIGPNSGDPLFNRGDPERRPDRIDVQADHRDRGARERGVDVGDTYDDTGQFCISTASAATTPARRRRRRSTWSTRSGSPPTTSSTTSAR